MVAREFSIHVPDAELEDLRTRLERTRWPDAIPGAGWDYGADVAYIKELCHYWRTEYDWRKHEADLNRYPQFLAEVDGVDIHFWHVKGQGPNPFPLMLIHGWPGSIYEFHHLIDRLTNPVAHDGVAADAFDVIIAAIPGFGWSGKTAERGWGITRVAKAFDTLMHDELGYERYGTQGGDWGGIISAVMGANHSDHVAAIHVNFVIGIPPEEMTPADQDAATRRNAFQQQETGYSALLGTKPQSLAVAQADSPAGIAAWITEKFRTWSDCNGDIESIYTKDQLLTNIMFYWAPNSIASAARIYYEARREAAAFAARIEVPTAVASFPEEPFNVPRSWVEPRFNIQRWTEMPAGGHFAAMEQGDLLVEDMRTFFQTVR